MRGLCRFLLSAVWTFLSLSPSAGQAKDGRTVFPKTFGRSTIKRLIEDNGFGYENYEVTTEDGYILNMNRMVNRNATGTNRGYPLLLVNGFFMHSEAWLLQTKADSNIAVSWSKLGYDVWLGDQRGTFRSIKHTNLTTDDDEFWDYTFQESGVYDTSAFVDFILQKTGHKDLIFSCMSLGCSFHAILASERPSYNEKIRGAIYFVPLVNNLRKVSQQLSVMQILWQFFNQLLAVHEKAGSKVFFPFFAKLRKEIYHLCAPVSGLLFQVARVPFGSAWHAPKDSRLCAQSVLASGGTNVKSARHIMQLYQSGDFAKFDYGREENMRRYGKVAPPLYDMKKITSTIAMYYSDADVFMSPEGMMKTIKSLGGPIYDCKLPNFNHGDVALGLTFHYVLPDVNEVLNELSGYSNSSAKLKAGKCPSFEWIRSFKS